MVFISYLVYILLLLLQCYLICGFWFAVGALFDKQKYKWYEYFLIIIFWSYSLYHWWRDNK